MSESPFLTVIFPGMMSTIQDRGRIGLSKYGFSQSGAADLNSLRLANLLVANHPDEACIEMCMSGVTVKFSADCTIAITGAFMNPRINGYPAEQNAAINIKAGDYLNLSSPARNGCRAYLALNGGFDIPSVMNSKSTNTKTSLGGLEGRSLLSGDILKFNISGFLSSVKKRRLPSEYADRIADGIKVLRITKGPQDFKFTEEAFRILENTVYSVSGKSDRMGVRLNGEILPSVNGYDIISDGNVGGAIQVSSNGLPIILLCDRQTTGGYAKIATIIAPDISVAGNLCPGDKVKFSFVSMKEARTIYCQTIRNYRKLYKKINRKECPINYI